MLQRSCGRCCENHSKKMRFKLKRLHTPTGEPDTDTCDSICCTKVSGAAAVATHLTKLLQFDKRWKRKNEKTEHAQATSVGSNNKCQSVSCQPPKAAHSSSSLFFFCIEMQFLHNFVWGDKFWVLNFVVLKWFYDITYNLIKSRHGHWGDWCIISGIS